jgi:hypothetical protein
MMRHKAAGASDRGALAAAVALTIARRSAAHGGSGAVVVWHTPLIVSLPPDPAIGGWVLQGDKNLF